MQTNTKPRVVMITSVYGANAIGGAERQVENVVNALAERGYDMHVLALSHQPSAFEHGQLVCPHVHYWPILFFQMYDPYGLDQHKKHTAIKSWQKALWHLLDVHNPMMAKRVLQVLKKIQPDAVITHALQGFSTAVWSSVKSQKIPLAHMVHDHALVCPNTAMTKAGHSCETLCGSCALYSNLRQRLSVTPDMILAPSEIVLTRHATFGWFHQVKAQRVIANALPLDWPERALADIPMPAQPFVFGYLGRLNESKGVDTLIEAIDLLRQQNITHFRVEFAGTADDDWASTINEMSVACGLVHYCGHVNAADFLSKIHVLITPSRAPETFCNVVMEAGALGVPAIVSDQGALPERVYHGETGWIFPASDAVALAQLMQQCMQEQHQVYNKATLALQKRSDYALDTQVNAFELVIADLIKIRGTT